MKEYGTNSLFPGFEETAAHFSAADELFERLLLPMRRQFCYDWPQVYLRFLRDEIRQIVLVFSGLLGQSGAHSDAQPDPRVRAAERLTARLHRASTDLSVLSAEKRRFFEEFADVVSTGKEWLAERAPRAPEWLEHYSANIEDLVHSQCEEGRIMPDQRSSGSLAGLAQLKGEFEAALHRANSEALLKALWVLEMLGSHLHLRSCCQGERPGLTAVCKNASEFLLGSLNQLGNEGLDQELCERARLCLEQARSEAGA